MLHNRCGQRMNHGGCRTWPATPEWMQSWVAPFMPENGQAEGTDRDLRAVVGELARQVADLQEQMAEGKDLPPGKK